MRRQDQGFAAVKSGTKIVFRTLSFPLDQDQDLIADIVRWERIFPLDVQGGPGPGPGVRNKGGGTEN